MVDLHLHSTASDGRLDPAALVHRVVAAGVRTLSLTDHDTMAGVAEAAQAAEALQIEFLPGVEITASVGAKAVHVLGYFLDQAPVPLVEFLQARRQARTARARTMADKLAQLGVPVSIEPVLSQATAANRSVTRPAVAQALVAAGHAATMQEAFDRWIGDAGPAYVACPSDSPADVVRLIARAGGVSALAHPGQLDMDDLLPSLAKAGLAAIEVYHPAHDAPARQRYAQLADALGLGVCGGSDFHGDGGRRPVTLGHVGLPREAFLSLLQRLLVAHSAAVEA